MADFDKPDLVSRVADAFEGLTSDTFTSVEGYCAKQEVRVLTILLGDQVDSTQRTGEITNPEGMGSRDSFRKIYRDALAHYPGQHIEYAGDAFLAVFASPTEAVLCALEIQARYRDSGEFAARIGLHDGEIVYREHQADLTGKRAVLQREVFGREVNLCARVCELAGEGRILLSRSVFDKARANIPTQENGAGPWLRWENWGAYLFKGVEREGRQEAYDVCEVALADAEGISQPERSGKSWPADSSDEVIGWRPAKGETVPSTNWQLEERLGRESGDEPGKERESSNFQGEFGEVWRAYNTSYKSHQVFKFCFKRAQLPALKREARLLKRLKQHRHPSLVEVYDVTEGDQPPHFLKMEYVEGPTMADWLAWDPPIKERLTLIAEVADALDLVHEEGIFHRDIKPTNILLERLARGGLRAKLTDFGLGATEDPELLKSLYASKVEGVAGTWDYIAPERREGGKASPQSDIYSLGLTLYQVLQGNLNATRPTNLARAIEDPILIADLERCLEDDPAKRWESAGELATALRSHEARLAQHHSEQEQARQRARAQQQRRVASVALLVAAIAISFGGFAAIQWQEAREQRRVAEEQALEARRQLYRASILQVQTQLEAGRFDPARAALWNAPVEHSGWEWGYLAQQVDASLATLEGHEDRAVSASFSPDGRRIVTASADGTARVWDMENGKTLHVLEGHGDWVWSALFSSDGRRIVTVSSDHTARVWDADTGEALHVLDEHEDRLTSASFSPDGRLLVTASSDHTARVWSAGTGEAVHILEGHEDGVASASFSPDGRLLVTASSDHTARVWDAESGEALHVLKGHTDRVTSASYSPDGRRIVTASRDHTAMVWETETGALHLLEGHTDRVTSASFSPDGRRIVTTSYDHTARMWDIETGETVHVLEGHQSTVWSASFSPDGRVLVTVTEDHTVRVWDAVTGNALRVLKGHTDRVNSALFSPDGRHIVTASGDHTARVWDAVTDNTLLMLEGLKPGDVSTAFTSDGRRIVTASVDHTARLWDANTGEALHMFEGHTEVVWDASFSPDGHRIVTASSDHTARVWDAETGEALHVLEGHTLWVLSASFSADGHRIFTSSRGGARLWDTNTGEALHVFEGHTGGINSASLSPDGRHIVTASDDHTARVWDVETGEALHVFEGHTGGINSASLSPDGRRIVTASEDHTARVWDVETGEALHALEGHSSWVYSASFCPDGRRIVTASEDHTARVWDVETGEALHVLQGHQDSVWSASFCPDGHRIVTASYDSAAGVWNADSGESLIMLDVHYEFSSAFFSPDGRRIVTNEYLNNTVHIWSAAPWRLEDLPPVEGTFDTPEEERKARFFEWKRQEYQRRLAERETEQPPSDTE